jgi:hypothetical protein
MATWIRSRTLVTEWMGDAVSMYETEPTAEPARIRTIAGARKQWKRAGTTNFATDDDDFFRDVSPEAVR